MSPTARSRFKFSKETWNVSTRDHFPNNLFCFRINTFLNPLALDISAFFRLSTRYLAIFFELRSRAESRDFRLIFRLMSREPSRKVFGSAPHPCLLLLKFYCCSRNFTARSFPTSQVFAIGGIDLEWYKTYFKTKISILKIFSN